MALSLDAAAEVFREAMRDTVQRYSLWYLIQGVLLIALDGGSRLTPNRKLVSSPRMSPLGLILRPMMRPPRVGAESQSL